MDDKPFEPRESALTGWPARMNHREVEDQQREIRERYLGSGVALGSGFGLAIGAGLGAAVGNLAWGIGLGLSVGAGVGIALGAAWGEKHAESRGTGRRRGA